MLHLAVMNTVSNSTDMIGSECVLRVLRVKKIIFSKSKHSKCFLQTASGASSSYTHHCALPNYNNGKEFDSDFPAIYENNRKQRFTSRLICCLISCLFSPVFQRPANAPTVTIGCVMAAHHMTENHISTWCQFSQSSQIFLGHIVPSDVLLPDLSCKTAITSALVLPNCCVPFSDCSFNTPAEAWYCCTINMCMLQTC